MPDTMNPALPDKETHSGRSVSGRPEPFQYSMATLFAVVTAYSVLFSLLSWLQLRSVWAFVVIVVYLTAIAFGQWSMFGGRHPYWASSLISSMLGIVATFAGVLFFGVGLLEDASPLVFVLFVLAPLLGVGFGGLVDITLLIIEIIGGIDRKVLFPTTRGYSAVPRISLRMRVAWLALLGIAFFFAVFMMLIENGRG